MLERDIKIIGLDLDGTVFNDEKVITPRTLEAIRAAGERGIYVLPATGRNYTGIPPEFLDMPGVEYVLTSNGASVIRLADKAKLVSMPFDLDTALGVYELLHTWDCLLNVFVDGECFTPAHSEPLMKALTPPALEGYFRATRKVVPDLHPLMLAKSDQIEKFSLLFRDNETRDKAWAAVAEAFPQVELTTSLPRNMEINAPGVHKGTGLLALASLLGFEADNIMACGDSSNDLKMLQTVGLAVAMGNATDEVKAVADVVTDDNNHDGVGKAIEEYALIRSDFD